MKTLNTITLFSIAYSFYLLYILLNFISVINHWFDSSQLGVIFISIVLIFQITLPILAGIGVLLRKNWPLLLYSISFFAQILVIIFGGLFVPINPLGYISIILNLIIIVMLFRKKNIESNSLTP